jgi:pre-rRNA-processing protein TSR2
MNASDVQRAWERFGHAIQRLFGSWTALQIAVEQGFGGAGSAAEAKDLEYDVFDFFRAKHGNVDYDVLEDLLNDRLDDKFDLLIEDGSVAEISRKLIMFCGLLQQGDVATFDRELARLPGAANTAACVAVPEPEDVMMDDAEMLSECLEDMNIQSGDDPRETGSSMDERPSSQTDSSRPNRNEPDADGWTTVVGNGKRKTKL